MTTERFALDLKEAAQAVGLSHHTLRKYCKTGKLRHSRVGRRILIEPRVLRDLVRKNRVPNGRA